MNPAGLTRAMVARAALLALLAAVGAMAGPRAAPEYNVKAGYLLLFTRYVTWPADSAPAPGRPFVLGVWGHDPFGAALHETFRTARVGGHPVEIRRIRSAEEAAACKLLFFPRTENARLAERLDALDARGALVVTESRGGLAAGAAVNFILEGNKIRFEVSLAAAERAGLRIASPMLVSARRILKGESVRKEEE